MVQIRAYQKTDYSAVKVILEEAKLFDEIWDSEANLLGMMDIDRESILVAIDDKTVLGNIYIVPFGDRVAFLFRLAVKKEYRNQGIASELIRKVEELLKKKGFIEVGLYVNSAHKDLHAFYQIRNFKASQKSLIYNWKRLV